MPTKKSPQSVVWWVAWIALTILSFFAASSFWTPLIARRFGSVLETRNAVIWVAAVFGTWMAFLLPLIVIMYHKVDKAYEDARLAREKAARRFRTIAVEKTQRVLPKRVAEDLAGLPDTVPGGHLVTLTLRDGRRIPNVFVAGGREILGIYDETAMAFEASEVVKLEAADFSNAPLVASRWLRLDGARPEE